MSGGRRKGRSAVRPSVRPEAIRPGAGVEPSMWPSNFDGSAGAGVGLAAIAAQAAAVAAAEVELGTVVRSARAADPAITWQAVGSLTGLSAEGARSKFGRGRRG